MAQHLAGGLLRLLNLLAAHRPGAVDHEREVDRPAEFAPREAQAVETDLDDGPVWGIGREHGAVEIDAQAE